MPQGGGGGLYQDYFMFIGKTLLLFFDQYFQAKFHQIENNYTF